MDWLTPTEQQAWVGLLATASALQHLSDRQLQADFGISFQTYSILAAVSGDPGATIHMRELSGITGHSQSRLSHAVARLERDGLVARSSCPSDRRGVHVSLTDAGTDLLRRAAPDHVAAVRRLAFSKLTPEQSAALADATGTIWRALVADGQMPSIAPLALDDGS